MKTSGTAPEWVRESRSRQSAGVSLQEQIDLICSLSEQIKILEKQLVAVKEQTKPRLVIGVKYLNSAQTKCLTLEPGRSVTLWPSKEAKSEYDAQAKELAAKLGATQGTGDPYIMVR